MRLLLPAGTTDPVPAKRFLTFPAATQQAILRCLRRSGWAQEVFSPVPIAEWWHVLALTDPLIGYGGPPSTPYWVVEGQLLRLLLRHYLDVLPDRWLPGSPAA